jgi:adenosine deaminase
MEGSLDLAGRPGIELHLHLEGCLDARGLDTLLARAGVSGDRRPAVQQRVFGGQGMAGFLAGWLEMTRLVAREEDFALFAEGLCDYMDAQGLLYAEVFYSPDAYVLSRGFVLERIDAAIDGVFQRRGVHVSLICDFVRNLGPESALRFYRDHLRPRAWSRVKGIGIGGGETVAPAGDFVELFRLAREDGYGLTAHAGEWAGPESVRAAAELLQVDRIGHGTSAVRDPALVDLLAQRRICLDLCPGSNRHTGSLAPGEDHPFPVYHQAGVPLSLNSDDPGFFRTSLKGELEDAARRWALDTSALLDLQLQAVDHSFLLKSQKQDLKNRLFRGWQNPPSRG